MGAERNKTIRQQQQQPQQLFIVAVMLDNALCVFGYNIGKYLYIQHQQQQKRLSIFFL